MFYKMWMIVHLFNLLRYLLCSAHVFHGRCYNGKFTLRYKISNIFLTEQRNRMIVLLQKTWFIISIRDVVRGGWGQGPDCPPRTDKIGKNIWENRQKNSENQETLGRKRRKSGRNEKHWKACPCGQVELATSLIICIVYLKFCSYSLCLFHFESRFF